jgi:2-keto-myo-inositol isomerase
MKLPWAFSSPTAMKLTWDEEFRYWEKYGWKHVEPWVDKIEACVKAGRTAKMLGLQMKNAGITPVGLAPALVWTKSNGNDLQAERDDWVRRLDMTADIGAPALTFVALGKLGEDVSGEYDFLAERLCVAGDLAHSRGVRINVEFLGGVNVNGSLGAGIDLIKRTDHPDVGMLFDLVHYYVSASHAEELADLPAGKLFHIHMDDSPKLPMEEINNEYRVWPGEGRINVPRLLHQVITTTDFKGWLAIEIYDKRIWELPAEEVFERTARSIQYVEAFYPR